MPRHAAPEPSAPKKKKRIKSIVFLLIIILLVGVLCFSSYKFLSEYIPQQQEQSRFGELRDLIGEDELDDSTSPTDENGEPVPGKVRKSKYEKLFKLNEDMRGWLKVDDTQIDYPVLKSDLEKGEYYLHRDFDGNYSFAGCLFIGLNCDYDSDIFIIYGHNMNNGSMFGGLPQYADPDYAYEHRYINFDTKDERRVYRVFAAFSAFAYPEDYSGSDFQYYKSVGNYDEDTYNSIMSQYENMAQVWMEETPVYPEQIMLLSTCAYHTENGRFVVAAYRVK